MPLFAIVFDQPDLKNLNSEQENFPGIDLGDETQKIAYQISSNVDGKKVTDALTMFVEKKHYERFQRLVFYDLVRKQQSYLGRDWDQIVDNRFTFSKADDILDYRDVIQKLRSFSPAKLAAVQEVLEGYIGSLPLPLDLPVNQVRSTVADFTNREDKIQLATEGIRESSKRMIVLHGMPGVGKTELAVSLVHELESEFPDAQLLIDLGHGGRAETAKEVLVRCIRAIRGADIVLPSEESQLQGIWRATTAGKKLVVILDNVETPDQAAGISAGHECLVVVTSRRSFALPGMLNLAVETLSRSDAKLLLTTVAPTVEDETAEKICRLCGDLPLALRAAGSFLAISPDVVPDDYANRLESEKTRLEALGVEGVSSSVESSFRLSYEDLEEETARVFRVLGNFPGSFFADAEKTVCRDAGHNHLSELLRRNLVIYNSENRRYELHELVRVFARKLLAGQPDPIADASFVTHYLSLGSMSNSLFLMSGSAYTRGLQLFHQEKSNISSAFDRISTLEDAHERSRISSYFLSDCAQILLSQLPPEELGRWAQLSLKRAEEVEDLAGASISLTVLGLTLRYRGRLQEAERVLRQALAIAFSQQDHSLRAYLHTYLGQVLHEQGRAHDAINEFTISKKIFCDLKMHHLEGEPMTGLGLAYALVGETNSAIFYLEQVVAITREDGATFDHANALANLAQVWSIRSHAKTVEFSEEAASIFGDLNLKNRQASCLAQAGYAKVTCGHPEEGLQQIRDAIELQKETGDQFSLALNIGTLGNALADLNRSDDALAEYERQYQVGKDIGSLEAMSNGLGSQCIVFRRLERFGEAESSAMMAVEVDRQSGNLQNQFITLCHLGETYVEWGKIDKAVSTFIEQVALTKQQGVGKNVLHAYNHLAKICIDKGDIGGAGKWQEKCFQWSRASKDPHDAPLALMQLAETRILDSNQREMALEDALEAQRLFAEIRCQPCLSKAQIFLAANGYICPLLASEIPFTDREEG